MRWCEVYLVQSLPVTPSTSFLSPSFLGAYEFDMATVEDGKATAVPDTERDPNYGEGTELEQEKTDRIITGDKVELQDSDAWDKLGYSFPTWRKW
jgi:hypothetical protein